ncbi:hypothetical protein BC938DRAFT_475752, partial [Jimgerdemannia flammicorona]
KKERDDIATAIEEISPESINKEYSVSLGFKDREDTATLRRAIVAYAENLRNIDLPISEAAFDNYFTNMLTKRFLDSQELKIDVYATIKVLRGHVNGIALAHSRAHRKRKKILSEKLTTQGGCFGAVPETPAKKARQKDPGE